MAADMTDETIAQYMERIEKMSIKEIQKEIEFLESPGYNCEGLVCADGVITPRTKMHRKVLWYKRMNQKRFPNKKFRRFLKKVEKQSSQFKGYNILCIR